MPHAGHFTPENNLALIG